jgi:phosphoribosylglycinamide formyltransferase 1
MDGTRIAVFLSGRGSNFMAIHGNAEKGEIQGSVALVVSDVADAPGLAYARVKGLRTAVFAKKRGESRTDYFERVVSLLEEHAIELVVLAGFMKVLSPNIIQRYRHRILNIHPALLPSFPGTHAQKQALEYGVKWSGCTVHFVDEGVDTGPIVLQEAVPVLQGDNEESLSARILEREHRIFPEAVRLFCEGKLEVRGRLVIIKQRERGCHETSEGIRGNQP